MKISKIILLQYVAQDILKSLSLSFCPLLRPEGNKEKAFWYNMNIAETNFTRLTFSNRKYVLLSCVVYRLTMVFLIQAMDLCFLGVQEQLFADVLQNRSS